LRFGFGDGDGGGGLAFFVVGVGGGDGVFTGFFVGVGGVLAVSHFHRLAFTPVQVHRAIAVVVHRGGDFQGCFPLGGVNAHLRVQGVVVDLHFNGGGVGGVFLAGDLNLVGAGLVVGVGAGGLPIPQVGFRLTFTPVDVHGTVAVVVSGQGHLQRGSARGGFHVHGRGGVGDLHLGGGLGPVVLCGGDGDGVLTDVGVLVRVLGGPVTVLVVAVNGFGVGVIAPVDGHLAVVVVVHAQPHTQRRGARGGGNFNGGVVQLGHVVDGDFVGVGLVGIIHVRNGDGVGAFLGVQVALFPAHTWDDLFEVVAPVAGDAAARGPGHREAGPVGLVGVYVDLPVNRPGGHGLQLLAPAGGFGWGDGDDVGVEVVG